MLFMASPALAVQVHVRIEGARSTIWGAKEPWVTPVTGTIQPPSGEPLTVNTDTPFGALERASRRGEFFYATTTFSFGSYVSQIGRYEAGATTGWVYKVNGISPPVGATDYALKQGDRVLWYFAEFGPSGGPKTLLIRKRNACFKALAQDDAGAATAVKDVSFRVNGRHVASSSGRLCPTRRVRSIRVTKPGFVRSVVLAGPAAR
jgi:hypothetical protein